MHNEVKTLKEPLLFLCHRIPFPPNKGDKITTFNLLKFLSKRYNIYLGTFIDDEFDKAYISELNKYCESLCCIDLTKRSRAKSGVYALFKGETVTLEHFKSQELAQWIEESVTKAGIDKFFVYASSLIPFVNGESYKNKVKVLDMADIDSDKWGQYAQKKPWYSKWIYQREQRLLSNIEQKSILTFDSIAFVTEEESSLFRSTLPDAYKEKIVTLSNGVDTAYFDPDASFDETDLPELSNQSITFTGAMDYWANEDAVVWFCKYVWPQVFEKNSDFTFYIVGGNPTKTVVSLGEIPGVVVTGRVPDVRPYISSSILAVAPMRIARGVQNKVLEAMAMAKPVVMTSMGQEGIELDAKQMSLVLDEPNAMAASINSLIEKKEQDYQSNRQWIVDRYSWEGALSKLPELLNITKELDS